MNHFSTYLKKIDLEFDNIIYIQQYNTKWLLIR